MRSLLTMVVLVLAVAGCGDDNNNGDGGGGTMDMSAAAGPDMFLLSRCGHPGDVGNSLGVGQFCTNQGPDCGGNSMAKTCSAIVNGQTPSSDDTYFCSFTCQSTDPAGICGENAACLCNASNVCACIPARCIPPADM